MAHSNIAQMIIVIHGPLRLCEFDPEQTVLCAVVALPFCIQNHVHVHDILGTVNSHVDLPKVIVAEQLSNVATAFQRRDLCRSSTWPFTPTC